MVINMFCLVFNSFSLKTRGSKLEQSNCHALKFTLSFYLHQHSIIISFLSCITSSKIIHQDLDEKSGVLAFYLVLMTFIQSSVD